MRDRLRLDVQVRRNMSAPARMNRGGIGDPLARRCRAALPVPGLETPRRSRPMLAPGASPRPPISSAAHVREDVAISVGSSRTSN
jgi:hypothetical protein